MGGGEVARYLGGYGSEFVSKAVFISSVPPFLLKTADNPEGVDGSVFDGIQKAIVDDRPAFLSAFFKDFYNVDVLGGTRISDQAVQSSWNVAVGASAKGTLDCVKAWGTDFREDLQKITVPTLVIHGDADRILPIAATGIRTNKAIKGSRLVVVEGGPHGVNWTHADKVNSELVAFLK
jgi:non-heme chloroperoxidase